MSQQPEQNKTFEQTIKDVIINMGMDPEYPFSDAAIVAFQKEAAQLYASQKTAALQKQVNELKAALKRAPNTETVTKWECGKLLNEQGIIMQRKIKDLEKQVEELRKCNDQILMKSIGQHERIAQLEEAIRKYCFWMRKFLNDKVVGQPPSLDELEQAINPQDNQKEK